MVYSLHHCWYFVLGCPDLTIATDHKPLLKVLGDRALSDMQNRRLQNLKEKTLSYKFEVVHVPGKQNLGPDATSRYPTGAPDRLVLPGEPPERDIGHDCTITTELRAMLMVGMATTDSPDTHADTDIGLVTAARNMLDTMETCSTQLKGKSAEYRNVVTWDDIRDASNADREIQELLSLVHAGFEIDARKLPPAMRPYHPYSAAIYELDGVAMLGERIIVPSTLRPAILNLLHAAH